jgi:GWxTD domain-containing protein
MTRFPVVGLLALALGCSFVASARAADGLDMGAPPSVSGIRFALDATATPVAAGEGTVEISYAVTYDELLFLRHDGGYRARYEITAILYGRDGEQVAGDSWRRVVEVDDYVKTNSRMLKVEETLTLRAEPGSYRLKVELRSVDTRSKGLIETTVEVPRITPGKLTLGTVIFERDGPPSRDDSPTAPHPSREYGNENPTVHLRIPVYGSPGTRYELAVAIEASDGLVLRAYSDTVRQVDFLTEHAREFDVLDLEVGNYFVKIRLSRIDGDERIVRRSRFRVVTSPKSWGEDFEKMISQISYVADRDDVERLMSAPEGRRDEAWEEFWQRHDPDPTSEGNEFKEEFLRRLGHANTQFKSVVEGWQTDMGRIYIQYGEPDDIDSQPVGGMLNAWETWYYYGAHTKFIFVDREGFGEYDLVEASRI